MAQAGQLVLQTPGLLPQYEVDDPSTQDLVCAVVLTDTLPYSASHLILNPKGIMGTVSHVPLIVINLCVCLQ